MKTPVLAMTDAQDLLQQFSNSKGFETLALLGALLIAILIGSVWAVIYSKKRKKRPHRQQHQEQPGYVSLNRGTVAETDEEVKVRKKWRRQRRPHRPLNPTLAQTRGLPPVRDHNTPPPLP
jgi:hypothetical protein